MGYGHMPPPGKGGPLLALEPGGRYQGRIKTFNSKHGFGFIDCLLASDRFGRDVFVHKVQMGDTPIGGEITFEVRQNKDGHPQAREVRRLDGSVPGPYPDVEGDQDADGNGGGSRKARQRRERKKLKEKGEKEKGEGKGKSGDGKDAGKSKAKPPGKLE